MCAVCAKRLCFDTENPIKPEDAGWQEMPVMRRRIGGPPPRKTMLVPVCKNCIGRMDLPMYGIDEDGIFEQRKGRT